MGQKWKWELWFVKFENISRPIILQIKITEQWSIIQLDILRVDVTNTRLPGVIVNANWQLRFVKLIGAREKFASCRSR